MNLTLANKNPFSTFDFLGYFFPGSFALILCYLFSNIEFNDVEIPQAFTKLHSLFVYHELIAIFFFIILAYITGHLISYLSSATIERFFVWSNGYPTEYLLSRKPRTGILESRDKFIGSVWHLFVCIFIAPITICSSVFESLFNLRFFITKELPFEIKNMIESKIEKLPELIELKGIQNAEEIPDIHRIVMHFVYEHCQQHNVKFDNYVALYGFLRSLSLIFSVCFLYQLWRLCFTYQIPYSFCNCPCCCHYILSSPSISFVCSTALTYWHTSYKQQRQDTTGNIAILFVSLFFAILITWLIVMGLLSNVPLGEIIILITTLSACYLSYLGFAKFYRRFTLENYMSFLIFKGKNGSTDQSK